MMQRHKFAKGYITHQGTSEKFLRVEESYGGQHLEIYVGDDDYECGCDDDCGCDARSQFGIDLSREQVKELLFVIKQLHFIDRE